MERKMTEYKLFLDDIREPVDDSWVIVRSYDEAVEYVQDHGLPKVISFDHDLGTDKTGHDFAKFLVSYILDGNLFHVDFTYIIHSANPVGSANIKGYLDGYLRYQQQHKDQINSLKDKHF